MGNNTVYEHFMSEIDKNIEKKHLRERMFDAYVKTYGYREIKYWFDYGKEDDKYRTFGAYYSPDQEKDLIQYNMWGKELTLDNIVRGVCSEKLRPRLRFRYKKLEGKGYEEEVLKLER